MNLKSSCKQCESPYHSAMYHKPRKAIKQTGKHFKLWQTTRAKWFSENSRERYNCYLCGKSIARDETTLDHVIPRSAAPELRYDLDNLQPCCWACYSSKGSKH